MIALQLLRESYTVLFEFTVIDFNPLQPLKAFDHINDTLDGIVIEVNLLQSRNASKPMLVTLDGIVIKVSSLQP